MIPLMKFAFLKEAETRQALSDFILRAPRLSMSEQCANFEAAFARYQDRQDAVLFNSGGSANLALLQALKNLGRLKDGDKVGFSALTWSTNTMPIIQLGMEPVAIDCDRRTLNVMSHNLEATLKSADLKALFITNALGFAGDLNLIKKTCHERGIILLEDNCEALGTETPTGKTGTFGVAATCSFFVAHHMSTIEGGMVVSDDVDLSEMLRIVRANGWDRNLTSAQQKKWRQRYQVQDDFSASYTFYDLGYNFRPTEITGFLGLFQLQYLPESVLVREKNYLYLEDEMKQNADLLTVDRSHLSVVSNFAVPVLCRTPELRARYLAKFVATGIEVRPLIAGNIQRQPFYRKYVKQHVDLPDADFIDRCGFYFGNDPELSGAELATLRACLQRT
jgi:CDP-6-deoxy-D-xylo-4-hexulose-3-dehydrase